jgi:predicted nucleic acid-binding protein
MKVAVDTNIFMVACLGTGASSRVVAACLRKQAIPLMGTALFHEYEDVVARTELFAKSRLDKEERDELLDIFLSVCAWTRIYYGWRPNLSDEADNHLVELANSLNSSTINVAHVSPCPGSLPTQTLSLNITPPG